MIGMIVTGHGNFATGLTSGISLLCGQMEQYEAVDFLPEDSIDALTEKLKGAAERLSDCEELLVLADLTGGSPYNVSVRLKMSGLVKGEVIGGANLPCVLEAYMTRGQYESAPGLAAACLEAGRGSMILFEQEETESGEDEVEFD